MAAPVLRLLLEVGFPVPKKQLKLKQKQRKYFTGIKTFHVLLLPVLAGINLRMQLTQNFWNPQLTLGEHPLLIHGAWPLPVFKAMGKLLGVLLVRLL